MASTDATARRRAFTTKSNSSASTSDDGDLTQLVPSAVRATNMSSSSSLISRLTLSQDTRLWIASAMEKIKMGFFYGWVPFILLIGFWRSEPKPSLVRLFNPLS